MKYLFSNKRSLDLVGVGVVAITIGLKSKKVNNYPAGSCVKGTRELTFNI